jgi:ADP-heptose:LPS heptosyltransferase
MRLIDRWLGKPLCLLLTVIYKICRLFSKRESRTAKIERILFIKLAEQGATVLADSAIRRAAEMVGRENVYFLVLEQNSFILDIMNVIPRKNILTISDKSFLSMLFSIILASHRIRRLRIDAAIDFEFFARGSAVLTFLSGASIRVGIHTFTDESPYRGDLMTHRLNYNPHIHTSQMFEVMVEALKLPPEDMPRLDMNLTKLRPMESSFAPGQEELDEFRTVLAREAGAENFSPLILLNPNASDILPLRRWPMERYVELARRLIEKSPSVYVCATGAPEEAEHSRQFIGAVGSPRCFSMAGKTSLRQLMLLYCLADALVTNDSGPAHFAALTKIQVITLFGPETPRLFGANSPRSHVIWKNIPCSPCVSAYNNRYSTCKNNICMQRIRVDEVCDLVCRICGL